MHSIVTKCEAEAPDFTKYLTSKLVPAIRTHVFTPRVTNTAIPLNWTNNNCEVMNHMLKMEVNWKPEKLQAIQRIVM